MDVSSNSGGHFSALFFSISVFKLHRKTSNQKAHPQGIALGMGPFLLLRKAKRPLVHFWQPGPCPRFWLLPPSLAGLAR